MKKYILITICLTIGFSQHAQEILDWEDLRQQMIEFHPLAKNAALQNDYAASSVLKAKGAFDPKTFADYEQKNFQGKTYFSHVESGIKLPTWYGLELKAGYNLASGQYLNPEVALPEAGQAVLGLNWTLGRGLFTDQRRTDLRTAEAGILMADAAWNSDMADLVFIAAKSYWNWVSASNQINVITAALQQAQQRHTALVESYFQGDKPAIDTLETYIQIQNRLLDLGFAETELQAAFLDLQNSAQPGTSGLSINYGAPDLLLLQPDTTLLAGNTFQQNSHPDIRYYEAKATQLNLEKKWKKEQLKPRLDIDYYLLGSGWQFFPALGQTGGAVLASSSKWGLNFEFPIPNRKARGDLQGIQIKAIQNQLVLDQKSREISNKIKIYEANLKNLFVQTAQYRQITANYLALLQAENEKFRQGESTVFLINSREQKWIDARIKYLKLLAEYQKMKAGWLNAQGKW